MINTPRIMTRRVRPGCSRPGPLVVFAVLTVAVLTALSLRRHLDMATVHKGLLMIEGGDSALSNQPASRGIVSSSDKSETSQMGDVYGDQYFRLSQEQRYEILAKEIEEYAKKPVTCETKFIEASAWCDANPGNGMNNIFKNLLMGFILNRLPLFAIYRKDKCEMYLKFRRPELVYDLKLAKFPPGLQQTCENDTSRLEINGQFKDLACSDLSHRNERVIFFQPIIGSEFTELAEILQDRNLAIDVRLRAAKAFDLGSYATAGMLSREMFTVTDSVTKELQGDYNPGEKIWQMLNDPEIVKIGVHIRHLPFVVSDEHGHQGVDKRASKCIATAKSLNVPKSPTKKCLLLLATDLPDKRDELAKKLQREVGCETFVIQRVANNSLEWGGPSISGWESRKPLTDFRSMLEVYLDVHLISEYADTVVHTMGSTFSHFLAIRSAGKRNVNATYEFAGASCKSTYFPFRCCHARQRWQESAFFVRNPVDRCK